MERQNDRDTQTPEDIRDVAAQLWRLGAQDRAAGEDVSGRVMMRTANLLVAGSVPGSRSPSSGRFRAVWLWIAAPAVAAAAVLFAIMMGMPQAGPRPGTASRGVEVLAAGLESDIDALLAINDVWDDDAFETGLAVISLDAARLANQTDRDQTFEAMGSDL